MTSNSTFSLQQQPLMMIVEDSDEDFEAFRRFLQRSPIAIAIQRCVSGDQALALLDWTGSPTDREHVSHPKLIVLDLNLPGTDGREVLRRIKQDERLKSIPVIVFTTSNNPNDIEDCYHYGANSYIIKPIDFEQLKRNVQSLLNYWFEVTMLPDCLPEGQ